LRAAAATIQAEIARIRSAASQGRSLSALAPNIAAVQTAGVQFAGAALPGDMGKREFNDLQRSVRTSAVELGGTVATVRRMNASLEGLDREAQRAARATADATVNRQANVAAGLSVSAQAQETALGTAAQSRVTELLALEATTRADLVEAVQAQLIAEAEITKIEQEVRTEAIAQLRAQGRLPAGVDEQKQGGLLGSIQGRLQNLPQLAVGGFVAYQVLGTVKGMIDEAQRAQVEFGKLRAQFDALGEGDQFAHVADQINGMSRDLGVASDVAVQVAGQMKGAFTDTATAIAATRDALTVAAATGQKPTAVADQYTPVALTFFGQAKDGIRQVSDEALHLHDVFGVASQEIVTGVANIAPLAKELGLTFNETATIIAGAAARSGRSVQQTANEIGRALTQVEKNAVPVLQIFQQGGPGAQAAVPQVAAALQQGNVGQVLLQVIRHWHDLTDAQHEAFLSLIGGRREFASLAAGLDGADKIIKELDDHTSHAGRTQQQFAEIQKTLAFQLSRLRNELRQLADNLVRSGLADFATDVVRAFGGVLILFNLVAGILAHLNEATHGFTGRIVELIVALTALKALGNLSLFSGVAGRLAGAGGVPTGFGSEAVGSAAAGIGPGLALGIAGVATGAAVDTYAQQRGKVGKAADDLKARLGKATEAQLRQLLKDTHESLFNKAGDWIFGQADPRTLIQHELGQRADIGAGQTLKALQQTVGTKIVGPQLQKMLRGLSDPTALFGGDLQGLLVNKDFQATGVHLDNAEIKRLNDAVKKGGKTGAEALRVIQAIQQAATIDPADLAKFNSARDALKGGADTAAAKKAAEDLAKVDPKSNTSAALNNLSAIQQALQAGDISSSEAVTQMEALRDSLQLIANRANPNDPATKQLLQVLKGIAATKGQAAKQAADFNIEINKISGTYTPAQAATTYGQIAGDTSLDPATRLQAAKDAATAAQDDYKFLLDHAKTEKEIRDIINRGVVIPPGAKTGLLTEQVALDQSWQKIASEVENVLSADDLSGLIKSAVDGNKSVKAVAIAAIQTEIANIQAALRNMPKLEPSDRKELQTALAAANKALADVQGASDIGPVQGGQTADTKSAGLAALQKASQANLELAKANAHGDPLAIAIAEWNQSKKDLAQTIQYAGKGSLEAIAAQAKVTEAADAVTASQVAIVNGQLELQKAQAAGNPVEQAQIAVQQAENAVASAHGSAERLNAMAQLVGAQQGLAQAQEQMADAYRNIDKAMAAAAGDTVGVALIELEGARAHLRAAGERGDVMAQLAAQAEVIQAQAGVVAAQISSGERNIDFALQIGQISTQQAITQLEALLKIPGITQEQTQQILLKINELRKSASKDLQFNIPTDIKLPTLYEVRRLQQSQQAGIGYNDNRQVMVQYNVYTPLDHTQTLQDLANVVGGGNPRTGVSPRTYP
jgi:TP901 family phage tail tape measure protein